MTRVTYTKKAQGAQSNWKLRRALCGPSCLRTEVLRHAGVIVVTSFANYQQK